MPAPVRTRRLPMLALAAGAALALSGCIIMPPPTSTAVPTQPTVEPQPSGGVEPTEETSPSPSSDPSPSADAGDLPEYVDFGTALEPRTLAGWETSILSDASFEVQPDSDFPAGPTISVVETATGCTFWAYQGAADSDSTDETASTEATLEALTGVSSDEWEADVVDLGPSASQGVTVAFLSLYSEDDATGDVEALYARNFQSSGTTSAIRANCGADAGGIDHIDEVVFEQFQINFLAP